MKPHVTGPRRTRRWAASALLASGLLAGPTLAACGSSDAEEKAVRSTVVDFLDEVGEQDYATACGFLTGPAAGASCPQALASRYSALSATTRSDLDDIDVDGVTVKGTSASVSDAEIRVAVKHTTTSTSGSKKKRKTKKKTTTTYHGLSEDVTSGPGFTLTKAGKTWKISGGV